MGGTFSNEEEKQNWNEEISKRKESIKYDFGRTGLKVAGYQNAGPVKRADKLLQFRLGRWRCPGGHRQIHSGITYEWYPDQVFSLGRKEVVIVANHVKMRGQISQFRLKKRWRLQK